MSEKEIGAMLVVIAGIIPCVVLGYLIAAKQKRSLIAGWDESKVSNPKAFAAIVGWSLIALAFALAAATAFWTIGNLSGSEFMLLLVAACSIPIASAVYARRKFGH